MSELKVIWRGGGIDKCKVDDDIKVHGGEITGTFSSGKERGGFFYSGFLSVDSMHISLERRGAFA